MIALQAVEHKRLVRLRDLEVRESASVGEVEFSDYSLGAEAGKLRVHLDVDTLVGLDAHNKLVSGNVLEDAGCDIFELDSDLRLLLVEGFAGLHDEGNAVPSLILNISDKGTECRASRVLWHGIVFLVGWLASVQ